MDTGYISGMIIGIGTDIASIPRIADVLKERGARFTERCFSAAERDHVDGRDPAARAGGYAKRWAAKEACAKAMGRGIRDGIFLRDIAVENDKQGRPSLRLTQGAAAHLATLVPAGYAPVVHVSLSDDGAMATAFVVIEAVKKEE